LIAIHGIFHEKTKSASSSLGTVPTNLPKTNKKDTICEKGNKLAALHANVPQQDSALEAILHSLDFRLPPDAEMNCVR
jgi:hypothetical protein